MVGEVDMVVTEVYQAEKRHYITGAVVSGQGGMLKVSIDGQAKDDLKAGKTIKLKGVFKPQIGPKGLFLQFLG